MSFFTASKTFADTSSEQIKKIQDAGVLKVGVKQDVPNFGYYSADSGKYEGMEVDLAEKNRQETRCESCLHSRYCSNT